MISKQKVKLIRSLENRKGRADEGLFVAEGPKTVGDMMQRALPSFIFATNEWFNKTKEFIIDDKRAFLVNEDELSKISFQKTPQQVLALFRAADFFTSESKLPTDKLSIALDAVQDPGNLGTIIRIADWFGIDNIVLGNGCADALSPKVVQATMGSLARVNIIHAALNDVIKSLPEEYPIYGTTLDGENIYEMPLNSTGLIIMGNEGNGISEEVQQLLTHKLFIPNKQHSHTSADSLNVAIATAITCSEFTRRL